MRILRLGLVALLSTSLLLIPALGDAKKADAATYTNQTNVSFTSSAGVTSQYHVYAAGVTEPAGLLLQFHGDGAYEFNNPTSSYSLGGASGIVAQAKARNFITVPVLSPDRASGITWWRTGSKNADYVRELVADLKVRYGVRTDRIWLVGYSGGAQFISQYFVPKYSSVIDGGGAIVIGGGDKPAVSAAAFSAGFKANFPMHWYTGANDTGWDGDGWNALAAAQRGQAWYANAGLRTTYEWPAGVSHTLNGKFGEIVAKQLDAHPGSGSGTTQTATPTATATSKPPATGNWVTAVKPNRTGVAVDVKIPKGTSGRTTLYVYGPNSNYWYTYTTSTGKTVTLKISSSLKAKTSYTYKVTNGSTQVGSGSFNTTS